MKRIDSAMLHAMLAAAIAVGLTAAACTGDGSDGSMVDQFCNRLDECNALDGHSVEECIGIFDECLGDLTESRRADWETSMDRCLELRACDAMLDCWANDVRDC
jgi:hypothetical protein